MTELMEKLQLNKTILVAPSMSGSFALPYVLTNAEKIAGLVLVAPASSDILPQSKVRAFSVPTVLVYGSKDTSLGATSHRYLKSIPHFQAVVFENAGHAAYLDQPDRFHKLLFNFAKKLETGV